MTDANPEYLIVVVSATDGKPALAGVYDGGDALAAGAAADSFDAAAIEYATTFGGYPDRAYLVKAADIQPLDALRDQTAEKLGDHE